MTYVDDYIWMTFYIPYPERNPPGASDGSRAAANQDGCCVARPVATDATAELAPWFFFFDQLGQRAAYHGLGFGCVGWEQKHCGCSGGPGWL